MRWKSIRTLAAGLGAITVVAIVDVGWRGSHQPSSTAPSSDGSSAGAIGVAPREDATDSYNTGKSSQPGDAPSQAGPGGGDATGAQQLLDRKQILTATMLIET